MAVTLVFGILQGWLILRVGLVAAVTFSFVSSTADGSAWPHDLSNWMVPGMLWVVGLIMATAALGFWLAIDRCNPFAGFRLEE